MKLEMFRMHEIPTSQMMHICGGMDVTGGGSYTAGAGSPQQYSFNYTSDSVSTSSSGGTTCTNTTFNGQTCTDGCNAASASTVVDPSGDYLDANNNFVYYNNPPKN